MAPNNFLDIMCESRDIIKPHRRHLFTLALIFLLPVSSSSHFLVTLFNHSQIKPTLIFHILYSFFLQLFSNCGVISITYSVFHLFHNHPVNLTSTIKSISTSFFPLLATTIVSHLIIFSINLLFGFLSFLLIHVAEFFDLTFLYSYSPYIMGLFVDLPHLIVMVIFQVNWTLVSVIVVVESCWGLEPLRRSTRLIKGTKRVALSTFVFFGFVVFVFSSLILITDSNGYRNNGNWVFVVIHWVIIVTDSYIIAMIMTANIVVNMVLYIHCKANHGEVVDEFGNDYVRLPFPDEDVSNVV